LAFRNIGGYFSLVFHTTLTLEKAPFEGEEAKRKNKAIFDNEHIELSEGRISL
jgi:hypothetical protein